MKREGAAHFSPDGTQIAFTGEYEGNVDAYGLSGEWEVENHGIAPDIEIEQDPKLCREGHDPQLERAVAVALQQLKEKPQPIYKRHAYPNYHPTFTGMSQ